MTASDTSSAPAARPPAWHSLSAEAALAALDSARHGLGRDEAARRLARHGRNALPTAARRPAWRRLLAQFNNVLIHVLLVSVLVTLLLGHWLDAGVIAAVVVLNALIGFVQEGRAEQALAAVHGLLSTRARVWRDGVAVEMDAALLVPGDIVELASGDRVPADLRLLAVRSLHLDEAALTGESLPVARHSDPVAAAAALGDRLCLAHAGSLVASGRGQGVVVATGMATEIGRISHLLGAVSALETPLLRQFAAFGRQLSVVILLLALGTFLFGIGLRDYRADEMFLAAVGLAVAAIPEGLPAILTITLAIGVQAMARRQAIMRRLPTVEALGAVTVICSDKTGTLTRNEMTVEQVILAEGVVAVSGSGYVPEGEFHLRGTRLDPAAHPALRALIEAGALCNDARLHRQDGLWQLDGDPTEGSLLVLAAKAGLRPAQPRLDAIPFESEHRYHATLHPGTDGPELLLVGAPERLLELCTAAQGAQGPLALDAGYWAQAMAAAAADGRRLLALARRTLPAVPARLDHAQVAAGGFTLLGVCAQADPPRPEAVAAVAAARAAGIRVRMITGDHAITALAIARALGLGDNGRALTGAELDTLDDAALAAAVQDCEVFARTSPEHKLRLVQALQAGGEVVAMTGDGVNDAPALKRADVGVAMGRKGTEAAREAADMVLADDNFASITAAVEEGRTIHDNIQKALVFILPTNIGQACMLVVAIAFGLTLPLTAPQILWVNLITAVTLALALAFERGEPDRMRRPPRDPEAPLLSPLLRWRVLSVALLLVAGALGLFLFELARGQSLEWARTVAVNALLLGELAYLFNCRHLTASALSREGLTGNPLALLAAATLLLVQLAWTYLPPLQQLFGSTALDTAAWGRLCLFAALLFLVVEAEKAWWHHRR